MPPEQKITHLENKVKELEAFMKFIFRGDRFIFTRPITFNSLQFGDVFLANNSGLQIGTATSQKIAFYGGTPVDQPATVSDPSGGLTVDAEARTAINALIDRLQELELIA